MVYLISERIPIGLSPFAAQHLDAGWRSLRRMLTTPPPSFACYIYQHARMLISSTAFYHPFGGVAPVIRCLLDMGAHRETNHSIV